MFETPQGDVTDVMVIKPVRLGLDDRAAETVITWKFKPVMQNEVVVALRMPAETTFHLDS